MWPGASVARQVDTTGHGYGGCGGRRWQQRWQAAPAAAGLVRRTETLAESKNGGKGVVFLGAL